MAAPTPTARGTPAGLKLLEGHATKITLGLNPTVSFWEMTVKPPGVDGGDAIDTTTMFNTRRRTKAPRALIEDTPVTGTAAYDPSVKSQIDGLVNAPTTITVTYPDGSTEALFGWLKSFMPTDHKEGEMPTADFECVISNWDYAIDAETAHALALVAGT